MGDINFRFQIPDDIINIAMQIFDIQNPFLKSHHVNESIVLKGDERLPRNACAVMLAYYEMLKSACDAEGEVSINRFPLLSITEHDLVPFHHKGLLIGRNEWTGSIEYALEIMPVVFIFDVNFEFLEGNNLLGKFVYELNGMARKRDWRKRKTIITTNSSTGLTTKHIAGLQEYFKFIAMPSN